MRKILKDIVSFIKYLLSFILKFKNISILMYHTVDHSNDFKNVIVKNFNKQLKFLKENKYHVIKLNTLLEKDYKNKIENSKNVIITFDDGDESLYINVFPILKKYQIPVTIFLISGFIGKKNYLNNNQIIEMFNSGLVDFGAHTVNHKKLHLLSKKELSYEIKQSKKDIDNILGINILSFAYPKGRFNSLVVNRVKK